MKLKRLNAYTRSFLKWKEQTQDTFEFSVLVCNAVPTLKRTLTLHDKGIVTSLVKPDHYGAAESPDNKQQERVKKQLREKSVGYKTKLSKYILISNFSFFESYVSNVIEELIEFHGGKDAFVTKANNRTRQQIMRDDNGIQSATRKLRLGDKPTDYQRYREASKKLKSIGYRFPTDLFTGYGIKMLLSKLANMSANDIPAILVDGFHLDLDDSEILEFHNVRDARNKVAHGESVEFSIGQVTKMSKQLRSIALKLDQHLLRYYFITEDYIN